MRKINHSSCIIGESPLWNEREGRLYITDMLSRRIISFNANGEDIEIKENISASALAFDKNGKMIISDTDGVYYPEADGSRTPLYDRGRYQIKNCNDMKVGPDGRLYVGTQSSYRLGCSSEIDGALFCIDRDGEVHTLLSGLLLSNGLDWSEDGKYFYHTDSDRGEIREYFFDISSGDIEYSGRSLFLPHVDGFCIDAEGNLYAPLWGEGRMAVVDIISFSVKRYIALPVKIPVSCCFFGEGSSLLAISSATYGLKNNADEGEGKTYIYDTRAKAKRTYLFGE